jgi:hypothetical protein
MGQDWLHKREKSIKRRLDRELIELSTPTLFTQEPECDGRIAAGELEDGVAVSVGEDLVASLSEQGEVLLYRGSALIGRVPSPSGEQQLALGKSPAVATVCDVLPFTGGRSVEVKLS